MVGSVQFHYWGDISTSMSCKEIVSLGENTLTGEGMWIINRSKPTWHDSKIYLQGLQTNWIGFDVLLCFMLWKIRAFLLLVLFVIVQKTSELEIYAKQTGKNIAGQKKRGKKSKRPKNKQTKKPTSVVKSSIFPSILSSSHEVQHDHLIYFLLFSPTHNILYN